MNCSFCGKLGKNPGGNAAHEKRCKSNPNIVPLSAKQKNRHWPGTNQFTKAVEAGLPVPVSKTKGRPGKSHPVSEEHKVRLSQLAIKRGLGGVTQSRWIKYKGKTLGSSYELKLAKDLDANGIKWDVCSRFSYVDPNGKTRTYTPDFYLEDYDIYLDPKNDFLLKNTNPSLGFSDINKIQLVAEQNKIRVIVLNKNELSWNSVKNKIAQFV